MTASMAAVGGDQAHTLPFKLTLGAQAAAGLVAGGDGGWLAPIVAVAASFFTVGLIWVDRTHSS